MNASESNQSNEFIYQSFVCNQISWSHQSPSPKSTLSVLYLIICCINYIIIYMLIYMLWAEFWSTQVLYWKTLLEKSTTFDPLASECTQYWKSFRIVPTVTLMLVTDVEDQMCWWQVWDVVARFRMLMTDLIHWQNH